MLWMVAFVPGIHLRRPPPEPLLQMIAHRLPCDMGSRWDPRQDRLVVVQTRGAEGFVERVDSVEREGERLAKELRTLCVGVDVLSLVCVSAGALVALCALQKLVSSCPGSRRAGRAEQKRELLPTGIEDGQSVWAPSVNRRRGAHTGRKRLSAERTSQPREHPCSQRRLQRRLFAGGPIAGAFVTLAGPFAGAVESPLEAATGMVVDRAFGWGLGVDLDARRHRDAQMEQTRNPATLRALGRFSVLLAVGDVADRRVPPWSAFPARPAQLLATFSERRPPSNAWDAGRNQDVLYCPRSRGVGRSTGVSTHGRDNVDTSTKRSERGSTGPCASATARRDAHTPYPCARSRAGSSASLWATRAVLSAGSARPGLGGSSCTPLGARRRDHAHKDPGDERGCRISSLPWLDLVTCLRPSAVQSQHGVVSMDPVVGCAISRIMANSLQMIPVPDTAPTQGRSATSPPLFCVDRQSVCHAGNHKSRCEQPSLRRVSRHR